MTSSSDPSSPTPATPDAGAPSLEEVVAFLDDTLDTTTLPDYPNALNGLQVEADGPVRRVAVAVDASEAVIRAVSGWADLILVHHGLFWAGLQPLTGQRFRRVRALVETGTALYSVHLPLDAHPQVGNAAVLAGAVGLTGLEPFGDYRGFPKGWKGTADLRLDDLVGRLEQALDGPVRVLPGGPDPVRTVGIVTGGGGTSLPAAAADGLDALITGEAQHHHAIDAAELGVTVLLGGHYATETWGVRALKDLLVERFGIEGRFVDSPTGM